MDKIVNTYYDLDNPLAYSGSLQNLTSGDRKLELWFRSQPTYTLHKATRRKFPTRKYRSSGLDQLWQADLVDMQQFKHQNKGYGYILTAIDVFSRYAWATPLKTKEATNVMEGFQRIFSNRKPIKLQTDQGTEFENRLVQAYFKKRGVHHYTVKSVYKAALVERFHRTLRSRMFRYFTNKGTREWWNVLEKLVQGYNNTPHRGIDKKTPNSLSDSFNESIEWERQQKKLVVNVKTPKFNIGDFIRLQKAKKTFDRGYTPNWTEEIFKVHNINQDYVPTTYSVVDDEGEEIEGRFYEAEMQKVEPVYRIEKVIKSKMVKGKKHLLVKWLGDRYPHPEWILQSDLI